MLEPAVFFAFALTGLATGFLAGLLGIGGGLLTVPLTTYILEERGIPIDLGAKVAIATSMATIVFTSTSSVRAHLARGAVRRDLVMQLSPGILFGAALASLGLFTVLKGTTLACIFAAVIGFSATQILLDKRPMPGREMPGIAGQSAAGIVIGMVSGLVGAGGGFISVPFMLAHNVPIIQAVATSAALGFPIALANAAGYAVSGQGINGLPAWSLGYIWLPALGVVAICSVMTAPLGASVAHRLPVARLKRIFAVVLYCLAAYMLWKGLKS